MPKFQRPSVETVVKLLIEQLKRENRNSESAPIEWGGELFKIERVKESRDSSDQHPRRSHDLPTSVQAYRFDGKPVLVGDISEATDRRDLRDLLRRYRNQALITRSWVGSEATSVSLFLIGPLGSKDDQDWNDWALEIELDEKVCRKIVWLLPKSPTQRDAEEFLEGTALAQPWKHHQDIAAEKLDSLAQLDLPEEWLEIFQNDTFGPDDVVRELIEVSMEEEADD
jgi:hypothetical protein